MVYVISSNGHPLMPTTRYGRVRRMLKAGLATVAMRCPFTIKLVKETGCVIQPISLGIDAGSKHIGVSATTEDQVLYESDVELRNDIVDLLSSRRELRRGRRNRNTRYRKVRFDNRRRHDGWLAPSVNEKVNSHLTVVRRVMTILPISKVTVEVASFDIQKIKDPTVEGAGYQQGEQLNFWNVREYVLFRDNHTCQCCKGKHKDKVLNVHHIESRKTGGDASNNLITLCETCHTGYHKGTVKLPTSIKRGMRFHDATFMGIMRWAFYNKLKEELQPRGIEVTLTYGYITKNTRIENNLPKKHFIDARCISGNPKAKPQGAVFYQRKVRCHNRQIHKLTILPGGVRKRNQAVYKVKGFRLFDEVSAKGKLWYIHGRRTSGSFVLRTVTGDKLEIAPSKIRFVTTQQGFITERKAV